MRFTHEIHHGVEFASEPGDSTGCGTDAWYTTYPDVHHLSALLETEGPSGRLMPFRPNRALLRSA
jgi:hypothetical protein